MRQLSIAAALLLLAATAITPRLFARSASSVLIRAAYPNREEAPPALPTPEPVLAAVEYVAPPAPVLVAAVPAPTLTPPPASVEAFTKIGLEASWEKPNVVLIVLADKNSRFQTGKDLLTEIGTNEVKALAEVLKSTTFLELEIDGHADHRGSYGLNKRLSLLRAARVYTTAVDFGVPNEKFKSVKGWSYSKPLVQGTGTEVWGRNRRVEVRVITQP